MRIKALVIRIMKQFYRDKRTVAMMILAPIFILTLLNLIFNSDVYEPKIGLVNVPEKVTALLEESDVTLSSYQDNKDAEKAIEDEKIDGFLSFENQTPSILIEGSDPTVNGTTLSTIKEVLQPADSNADHLNIEYLYGSKDISQFDSFGPVLLGFFSFFFVFLVAGVSFLRERTSGTLERLLSSPIRRWELVLSYVIGFGLFTMIQSSIIVVYSVYILNMINEGSIAYVLLTNLLLSLTALTLGILLSSFAKNELQMMQFIPLIVVPQVFFSGLFNLETISSSISWISIITPLYYAGDALKDVMIRGKGFEDIIVPLAVLLGFSVIFIIINIISLKKYRKI
ncbi:ABC transporter permease [Niallia sp. 03190]|uniref:ABC transporter permease n=1 Tax=Niallia sp. 03190 TaxID=3458061 RepID=UPI0040448A4B